MARSVSQLPGEWIGPRRATQTWTTLGTLASSRRPVVDETGLVTPWPGGWSLDWWIGADDRWHFPSRETGVRQRLVDGTPVVETALRIPGGDAVHRAYAVRVSGVPGLDELLVVEIHNQSPVPFALALAVRPYNSVGLAVVNDVDLVGSTVTVAGRQALLLPAPPRLVAGSTLAHGDSAALVAGGGAQAIGSWPRPLRCPAGLAQAAFLYPMAHTATLRVAIALSPDIGVAWVNPATLPSGEDTARAWRAQSNRGLRLDLPVGRLADAVEANRRYLLLFHGARPAPRWPDAAPVVSALNCYGFHDEAAELLTAARGGWRRRRRVAPDNDAGDGARGALRLAAAELEAGNRRALDRLQDVLDSASPTWVWPGVSGGDGHDRMAAAEFCLLVRNLLVREVPGGLSLLTFLPDAWLGRPIEVHDAPTDAGLLSYAVRWHGERPALLWELHRHQGLGPGSVRLAAPGLDPSWSTVEVAGETLLAATAVR